MTDDREALEVVAEQATGRGVRGVVAAAAPIAAAIGSQMIWRGGNAYDAAVAAALAETVLLPPKCGLAGDLIALCLSPGSASPQALIAVGEAPGGLEAAFRSRGRSLTGPVSVGVPAAPAGYSELAGQGLLGLEQLVTPAIVLAREGFAWARICAQLSSESLDLVQSVNPTENRFFPGGVPHEAGAGVRLPGLADLLEELAELGGQLFAGEAGKVVAGYVREAGGVLTEEDLAVGGAEWVTSIEKQIPGMRMWVTPAPTHGPALLAAMSGATPGDLEGAVYRRVAEAMAVRDQLADPGTSMVSAADSAGNVVMIVHSNSFPRFGSGLVVPRYDLILSNRAGRGFSGEPGHPNFPAPGRRPATTLHAWACSTRDGLPELMGGTPGGENQMPWNTQTLTQVLSGVTDPGELVTAPRWEWLAAGRVRAEQGFSPADLESLQAEAQVDVVPRWGLRCAQQVVRVPTEGHTLCAGVDPRTGGAVVGA